MCAMAFELELDSYAYNVHQGQIRISEDQTPVSETTGNCMNLIIWVFDSLVLNFCEFSSSLVSSTYSVNGHDAIYLLQLRSHSRI